MSPHPTSGPEPVRMRDRPILFSTPMILALLREARQPGTGKTQTRRVLTRLPKVGAVTEFGPSDTVGYDWHFRDSAKRWHDLRDASLKARLPYAVGDRLWVSEAWRAPAMNDHLAPRDLGVGSARVFEADGEQVVGAGCDVVACPIGAAGKLRPSIHMPRWASRLTLLVESVRVERLTDISRGDAMAEGIVPLGFREGFEAPGQEGGARYDTAVEAFAALWNSINGPGAWAVNPWVCVIGFRPVEANIDALANPPRCTDTTEADRG